MIWYDPHPSTYQPIHPSTDYLQINLNYFSKVKIYTIFRDLTWQNQPTCQPTHPPIGVRGGWETWNLCSCLWWPSFLWLIFTGPRGPWPPRPPLDLLLGISIHHKSSHTINCLNYIKIYSIFRLHLLTDSWSNNECQVPFNPSQMSPKSGI